MRGLLHFLKKYHLTILFVILEVIAVSLVASRNSYHSAKIYKLNYSISGSMAERNANATRYRKLYRKNRLLIEENTRLYNTLDQSFIPTDSVTPDTNRLRKYSYIPARVINNSINKQYNFITIDKGSRHGIAPDMGVICGNGIVGRVKAVTKNYASVLPVLNRDFSTFGKIKKNEFYGEVIWPGKNYRKVILNQIPQHAAFEIGDSVVTFHQSGVFPEGVFIGTITGFDIPDGVNYVVDIELSTDFKKLGHVMVVNNLLREEQKILEESVAHD